MLRWTRIETRKGGESVEPSWKSEMGARLELLIPSSAERAAQRIADMARECAPGDRLGNRAEIREICQVSVGTLHEALRILQSRGIVSLRPGPGGGLFVSNQAPVKRFANELLSTDAASPTIRETIRIAKALDPLIVDDAARHASPERVQDLQAFVGKLSVAATSGRVPEVVKASIAVYKCLVGSAQGEILRSFMGMLLSLQIIDAQTFASRYRPQTQESLERHAADVSALVAAISDHDPEGARAILLKRDPLDFFSGLLPEE